MSHVSHTGPGGSAPWRQKDRSKGMLWPTTGAAPMKTDSSLTMDENGGAPSTSRWLMPVYPVMKLLRERLGLTNDRKVSSTFSP